MFYRNGAFIGTGTVVDGVATLTVSNLPLGESEIMATYSGDVNYSGAASSTFPGVLASTQATPTTTSLTTSQTSVAYGAPITLTATVASTLGTPLATGSVDFYSGSQLLGTGAIVNGQASLTTTQLPLGIANLRAVYQGDGTNAFSIATAQQSVVKAATTITLDPPVRPAEAGNPIVFGAQISGGASGGMVAFFSGTTHLGTANVVNGRAEIKTFFVPSNAAVRAVYSGDTQYLSSVTAQDLSVAVGTGGVAPSVNTTVMQMKDEGTGEVGYPAQLKLIFGLGSTPFSTGIYSVFDNGQLIGSFLAGDVSSQAVNGKFTALIQRLSVGNHFLTVMHSGGADGIVTRAGSKTTQISPAATEVKLDTSRPQAAVGAP
ncbi:Ig-like domain-containing protein, partial [Variovorax sp. RHLX14]